MEIKFDLRHTHVRWAGIVTKWTESQTDDDLPIINEQVHKQREFGEARERRYAEDDLDYHPPPWDWKPAVVLSLEISLTDAEKTWLKSNPHPKEVWWQSPFTKLLDNFTWPQLERFEEKLPDEYPGEEHTRTELVYRLTDRVAEKRRAIISSFRRMEREYGAYRLTPQLTHGDLLGTPFVGYMMDEDAAFMLADHLRKIVERIFKDVSVANVIAPPPLGDLLFEHAVVWGASGSGKTNILKHWISDHLKEVFRNEASIVVMESKNDLINELRYLPEFAPGWPLEGKLLFLDATDVEYPPAINLFQLASGGRTPLEKDLLNRIATDLLNFVFSSILNMELTGRQGVLMRFTLLLLMEVEGARLDDMMNILRDGPVNYLGALGKADRNTQNFFAKDFANFADTRTDVQARLSGVQSDRRLARLFSSKHTKLDLFEQMAQAKVILISIPSGLLGVQGVENYGRFWIALILIAAQRRQFQERSQRMKTYFYIDECQTVLKKSTGMIEVILDQARDAKVALILASQRPDMDPPVISAIMTNTAVKLASEVSPALATVLASSMRTKSEFILGQPRYHMAIHLRGMKEAASVSYPRLDLLAGSKLSKEDASAIQAETRKRFCNYVPYDNPAPTPYEEKSRKEPPQKEEKKVRPRRFRKGRDDKPSSKW